MGKVQVLDLMESIGRPVVMKPSKIFPEYEPGDDVDLLVLDRQSATASICRYYDKHFENEGELLVTDTVGHCHADFIFGGNLELRIDLIDQFDFYKRVSIKRGFVAKIFRDCQEVL